jgi:xanthine dehydrogenase YagT iron-sulfur-binding subunit
MDANELNESRKEKKADSVSRRSFLTHLGMAGVAVATGSSPLQAQEAALSPGLASAGATPQTAGTLSLSFVVNKKRRDLKIDPRTTLLDCLRENLDLTGTKKGCDHGQCGACTVHINGRRANSCLTLAIMCQGDDITTIEGLGTPENMHPMQKAFVDSDAYQCGYCTSGQIMSATALLKEGCSKKNSDIREGMSGNICRCGAYQNILSAIKQVQESA